MVEEYQEWDVPTAWRILLPKAPSQPVEADEVAAWRLLEKRIARQPLKYKEPSEVVEERKKKRRRSLTSSPMPMSMGATTLIAAQPLAMIEIAAGLPVTGTVTVATRPSTGVVEVPEGE